MPGFALYCPAHSTTVDESAGLIPRMEKALLRSRNDLSNVRAISLAPAGEHAVIKLEAPHSRPAGIYRAPDGSWIFSIGPLAYRGKAAQEFSDLLPELLRDIQDAARTVFRRLDGLNVVVAFDRPSGRLLVLQNPLAFLPVYVRESSAGLGVSTSILALAELGSLTLDPFAMQSQYRLGHRLAPYTMFSEIRSIPPGHILEIRQGRPLLECVWRPAFEPDGRSVRDAVEEICQALVGGARGLIPPGADTVCDITGGYDSRTTAAMLRAAGMPFSATVSGYPDHPDVLVSQEICRGENIPLRRVDPLPAPARAADDVAAGLLLAEGTLDAFHFTGMLRAKRENLGGLADPLAICGAGGEFFRDFNWAHEFANRGRRRPASIDRLIRYRHDADPHRMDIFSLDWHEPWRMRYKAHLEEIAKPYRDGYNTAQIDAIYLHKLSGFYGVAVSGLLGFGAILLPLVSLPALEISLAAPPQTKYGARFQRRIIHRLSPDLARYSTLRGCPAAPLMPGNCHRFLSRIPFEAKRLARKLGSVWLRRNWFPVYAPPAPAENPFGRLIAREVEAGGCLDYDSMATAGLYDAGALETLLAASRQPAFRDNRAVSWIYTFEAMARRAHARCPARW